MDGEEIASEIEQLDQAQLVAQLLFHLVGDAIRPAPLGAFPRQMLQIVLRRLAVGHRLLGIFVAQLVEAEVQRVGECTRGGNRMRPAGEQPRHFVGRLQMPFGIRVQQETGPGDRRLLADAGDDVLQRPAVGRVIMDVVGRNDRAAIRPRQPVETLDPCLVAAAIKVGSRDVAKRGNGLAKPRQLGFEGIEIVTGPGDEGDAFTMLRDVLQHQLALALGRAHLAAAQQPRQSAIAVAVTGISEQRRRIAKIEPAADQRLQPRFPGGAVQAHHAGQRVAVGDPEAIHAELERPKHQLDRVRGAAQEGERRSDAQLDVGRRLARRRRHVAAAHQLEAGESLSLRHQPNSPWRYQLGAPPRPSPAMPSR